MPPFGKPRMSRTRDAVWMRNAKSKDFAQPEFLWGQLWPKFNTISLPIHDESLFFADALAAAKEAENHTQLEELMEKKLGERYKEMESLLLKVAYAVAGNRDMLRSPSSRKVASRICQTGSLDNFMQFLGYSTFGWGDETLERKEQPPIRNGHISGNWDDADLDLDHPDFQTQPDSETELIVPMSPPSRPAPPQNDHHRIGTATAASMEYGASLVVNRLVAADKTAVTQAPSAVCDPRPGKKKAKQRWRGARPSSSETAKEEQEMTQVGNSPGSLRRAKRLRFADGEAESENGDGYRRCKRRATDEQEMTQVGNSPGSLRRAKRLRFADGEAESENGDGYRRCKRRATDEQVNGQSNRAPSTPSMPAQKRIRLKDCDDETVSHGDTQTAKRRQDDKSGK